MTQHGPRLVTKIFIDQDETREFLEIVPEDSRRVQNIKIQEILRRRDD